MKGQKERLERISLERKEKKMKKILLATTAAFGILFSSEANASLLQLIGGNTFVTLPNNSYAGSLWVGRTNPVTPMSLVTTQNNVTLTFEYVFREINPPASSFNWTGSGPTLFPGNAIPNNTVVPTPPSFTVTMPTAGLIPFKFSTILGDVVNGGTGFTDPFVFTRLYSTFISFNDPFSSSKSNPVPSGSTGNVAWIAFDASPLFTDLDYDDMIIKVTASVPSVAVSEPNALALFLAGGLGLLGLLSTSTRLSAV